MPEPLTERVPNPDYEVLFDLAPIPLVLLSPDFLVVQANREWLARAATTRAATVGRSVLNVHMENWPVAEERDRLRVFLEQVRAGRRAAELTVRLSDVHPPQGGPVSRVWTFRTVPVLTADGEVAFLLHRAEAVTADVPVDDDEPLRAVGRREGIRMREVESALRSRTRELERVDAQLRALGDRERRRSRALAGLATTVSALAAAESREDVLRHLFRHGRDAFDADALAVAFLEAGGGRLTVVDASGPNGGHPGRPLPVDSPLPIATAAAGRPVYQSDAEESRASPSPLPGLRAWAALPLHFARRPLGSITIGWRRPRALGEEDIRLLEALAAECAQALDRVARLETERRKAAATRSLAEILQRSLLADPPRMEHIDIAVRYRPAAREAQVGGDWYDAFPSPAGVLTVAVGDVTGHDRTAAALAGQLRNMLRGIVCASERGDPARMLTTLDRALRETGVSAMATALVARIDTVTSAAQERTFRWSNAGHPPPLLIEPDGTARLLQSPSELLLGVAPDVIRHEHVVPLQEGATVLLYTDGLIERHDATLDDGWARLLAAAPPLAARPVDQLCDELFTRLDPELTDDIALLALRPR